MKFKRTWEKELTALPFSLRIECIDYKAWKKRIKNKQVDVEDLLTLLKNDMNRIEYIFKKTVRNSEKCIVPILGCYCSMCFEYNSIYAFIKLNKTCVYKIAKKCDKHRGTKLMSWYNIQKKDYSFCGGYRYTYVEAHVNGDVLQECPICLEEQHMEVILDCGHCICKDCAKGLFGIQKDEHGTFTNLVNYALYTKHIKPPKCPICRAVIDNNIHVFKYNKKHHLLSKHCYTYKVL